MRMIKNIEELKEYVRETEELCAAWRKYIPTANVANAVFSTPDAVHEMLEEYRQFGG